MLSLFLTVGSRSILCDLPLFFFGPLNAMGRDDDVQTLLTKNDISW